MNQAFDPGLDLDLSEAQAVLAAKGKPFHELVRIAGLDPATDFQGANLSGMTLHLADLRGFDLSRADLRGTGFLGARRDRKTRIEGAALDPFDADLLGRIRKGVTINPWAFVQACQESGWEVWSLSWKGFDWRDALAVHAGNEEVIEAIVRLDQVTGLVRLAVYRLAEAQGCRGEEFYLRYALCAGETCPDSDAVGVYQRAVAARPRSAPILGNFANFMLAMRGDMDEAERLFRAALAADPNHAAILGNFALFMERVRGNREEAERLYRAALQGDPRHAKNKGNLARLLIARGREDLAAPHIEIALAQASPEDLAPLRLECWFYRYAVFPEERKRALANITALLDKGVRSPGFDLSGVVARAKELGHPDPVLLEQLAARIGTAVPA